MADAGSREGLPEWETSSRERPRSDEETFVAGISVRTVSDIDAALAETGEHARRADRLSTPSGRRGA